MNTPAPAALAASAADVEDLMVAASAEVRGALGDAAEAELLRRWPGVDWPSLLLERRESNAAAAILVTARKTGLWCARGRGDRRRCSTFEVDAPWVPLPDPAWCCASCGLPILVLEAPPFHTRWAEEPGQRWSITVPVPQERKP